MIVSDSKEPTTNDGVVSDAQWTSLWRLLTDDGMDFSFHIKTLRMGSEHTFHYKHHVESVYCISGAGRITYLAAGETHEIPLGVMNALDQHNKHSLVADDDLVIACCFNPPMTGSEVYRKDGSYAPAE